ncbi:MAG: MATE family efflux transporter [Lachnospirales bacterium]
MNECFCNKKFKSLLFTGTFTLAIQYLLMLSNTIIIGNILGETELSAMSIINPIYSVSVFIAALNSIGTTIFYSYEMGKFNKDRANGLFGQGVIFALATGIIMFLVGLIGKKYYFDFMNLSENVRNYAREYYFYYQFVILLFPVYTLLLDMVYTDGDGLICDISNFLQMCVNITASILLCKAIGIAGVALASLISTVLCTLVLFIHFFRKKNSLKFVWYIKFKDIIKVIKCGMTDSGIYLFWGLTSFVASKFVISNFGEYYLPLLLVIFNIFEMTVVFDGIGQAVTPIVNVYRGEGNNLGIKKVMKTAFKFAVAEGVIMSVVLFFFGEYISKLFGLTDISLVNMSKTAIRLISPFFFCSAILFLQTTYYLIIEKEILATVITGIKDFVLLTISILIFGSLFGINGVWIGFGITPLISLGVSVAIVIIGYGKDKFPFLFDKDLKEIYIFDTYLTEENIINLRNKVEKLLIDKKINQKTIHRVMLVIEEIGMLTYEKNKGKKILAECSIMIDSDVSIIIRDDGIIYDPTDTDSPISSLRSYMVSSLMINQPNKFNLVTTGYNRNMFKFDK